jgi:hypothetical protein
MAVTDPNAGATPAIDVAAITKSVTEALAKTLTERYDNQFAELTKNIGVLADTLKNAPPAKTEDKKADDKKPETVTPEAVAKIVADQLAAADKARSEAATTKAQRDALIAKVTKEKLGGDADLGALLVGDDEAALVKSADALATKIKTFKPDFGGVAKEGGETPGETKSGQKAFSNLSPGTAAYASSLKLPA